MSPVGKNWNLETQERIVRPQSADEDLHISCDKNSTNVTSCDIPKTKLQLTRNPSTAATLEAVTT